MSDGASARRINCAVIGVGNCASALIQGVALHRAHPAAPGSAYASIGGYSPASLYFTAAWDVDARKVGAPLPSAIFAPPNCCMELLPREQVAGAQAAWPCVRAGPVLDGVAPHMLAAPAARSFRLSTASPDSLEDAVAQLRSTGTDVLINYLPVGSQRATEFWAEACLEAKVCLVNCIPVFIASGPAWEARFAAAGLPLVGDDMRSQMGASALSQALQELAFLRGCSVQAHIQQNSGGNTDFLNMTDPARLASKKISKENVLRAQNELEGVPLDSFLHAGPSDYIAHYGDLKVATLHLELEGFGGAPISLDATLRVQDSPNSAGVVVDAVRFLQVAKELGIRGALRGASAFTQKTPPQQLCLADARAECDALAARCLTDMTRAQVRSCEGAGGGAGRGEGGSAGSGAWRAAPAPGSADSASCAARQQVLIP